MNLLDLLQHFLSNHLWLFIPLLGASGIAYTPANGYLNRAFRAVAYSDPTTLYFGLYTATPSDSGGGTEVSGNNYGRVSLVCNTTNWPTASTVGSISTGGSITITFPQATPAGWGTVTQFGIFDALTTGNLMFWGDLTASKIISNGDVAQFAGGQVTVALA